MSNKIQLNQINEFGQIVKNLYPVTKGDYVELSDLSFFNDKNLENNLKGLVNSKYDNVNIELTNEGAILKFISNEQDKKQILIPMKNLNLGSFIEFNSKNASNYRMSIDNDGKLKIYNSIVDTAQDATIENTADFKGLIINHIYGGGEYNVNKKACSHSFIELYNNSKNIINLKGLSIQYATNSGSWQVLPLKGLVKPQTSFLIRCKSVSDINDQFVRFKIHDYDMDWDMMLSDKGMKVYLCVGTSPCEYVNPFNIDNNLTKAPGYIDLLGVGGDDSINELIDGYETSFINVLNDYTSVHRIDFNDKDNSDYLESLNLKISEVDIYKPRCSNDGQWNTYYNKLKLNPMVPTMINICFGQDGNTTRTFTWQTIVGMKGYLKYRKKQDSTFATIKSNIKQIAHPDTTAFVHSVIIRDLVPGTYVYKVGCEGHWTDEYEFEVKAPITSDTIKFIQVTDQQSWDEKEYSAWEKSNKFIEENEEYDFIINTGDISQNGGDCAYEWRYYYEMAKNNIYSKVHMMTIGNNDLTVDSSGKKTDPESFTWYSTCENSSMVSCHSFNYGFVHFICLNSNIITSDILTKQVEWMRTDMAKPENQKRWTIVYMHEAPYTIVRSTKLEGFINVFDELGVDLVLCGHHHRYTRTKKMGSMGSLGENIESPTGFHCVTCLATGFKTQGKQKPASNSNEWLSYDEQINHPGYIMWEITNDKIVMHAYKLENILPLDDNLNKTPNRVEFDMGFEITKS